MLACSAVQQASSKLVAWLRAPAFAPNVLERREDKSFLARLTLAPLLFVAFSAIVIVLVRTTEIYVVRNGIGDDGVIYASIVRAYDGHLGHIQALGLNAYTAQRCLNPFIIHHAMSLFRMPTDDQSIIAAYKVANAISIMIAVACSLGSARHLKLSRAGLLVAVMLANFNFVTLYWLPFDPVVVDGMTLAVGSLQLWAYLSRRYVVLALVSAAGGFIWPSSMQLGAAMLFFPRRPADATEPLTGNGSPASWEKPGPIDLALAAIMAAIITWYASTLADFAPGYGQVPAVKTLFRLSCAILCFVSFIGLKELLRVIPSVRQLLRRDADAITAKILAVVMVIVVSKALQWISIAPTARIPQASTFVVGDALKAAVFFAVQRPAIPIFAHVGFFGPGILLLFWCWRKTVNGARGLGFGVNAALGMAFLMMFNSQSRGCMDQVHLLVLLPVLGAARLPWTPRRLWELAIITFIASKLWFSIVQRPVFDFASIMNNVGSWMSHESYAAHGALAIGASIWILWMSKQRPPVEEVIWLSEEQPPAVES
jgi:hypothetical protein